MEGKGLGDLVSEMHRLYSIDPNVIKNEDEVPESSRSNYQRYHYLLSEINRREKRYKERELSNWKAVIKRRAR